MFRSVSARGYGVSESFSKHFFFETSARHLIVQGFLAHLKSVELFLYVNENWKNKNVDLEISLSGKVQIEIEIENEKKRK